MRRQPRLRRRSQYCRSCLSADRDNEYFSDGLTEKLINVFAKMRGLRVASRTSAFAFKGKDTDVRDIGRRLNASSVLVSVRRSGNRVRITAQLISVVDGYHLWSETYDRDLVDVFVVQGELARAIAGALKVRLVGEEALVKPPTDNPEACTLYLKGRFFWKKRTPDGLRKGIELFSQAIALDPTTRWRTPGWQTPITRWPSCADTMHTRWRPRWPAGRRRSIQSSPTPMWPWAMSPSPGIGIGRSRKRNSVERSSWIGPVPWPTTGWPGRSQS